MDAPTYYHDPDGRKWSTREQQITELMTAAGTGGGTLDRAYWELVYDNEEAPFTTDAAQLKAAGFELTPPASLDDDALAQRLALLLRELERMQVRLFNHETLSDRELYTALVEHLLHEERRDIPMGPGAMWVIDAGREDYEDDWDVAM